MKVQKKIANCGWRFIWLVTLLFFAPLQGATAKEPLSPKAVSQKLRFYADLLTLEAPFKQIKHIKGLNLELRSEGELAIIRPASVIWKVLKPSLLVVILNQEKVRIESGEGDTKRVEELSLSGLGAESSMASLVAWLQLDVSAIVKNYNIYQDKGDWYRCEPKALAHSPFERIRLRLHRSGHLEQLAIDEKSGDTIEIRFGKPTIRRK